MDKKTHDFSFALFLYSDKKVLSEIKRKLLKIKLMILCIVISKSCDILKLSVRNIL